MSAADVIATLDEAGLERLEAHSPVGPSSGERWIHCPGSVLATIHLPDTQSDYAAEGSFAHSIVEAALNAGIDAEEYEGETSEDGKWTVDKEMVDAVQNFIDYTDQHGGEFLVEQRIHYDELVEVGFGTSDYVSFIEEQKLCIIKEFKYGEGIKVNAKHNYQLKLQAGGVLQDYGEIYDFDKFLLCVSQPRLDHRDQWEVSVKDIQKWMKKIAAPAGKIAWEPDAPFKAGAWCQFCGIKGECKTRAKMMREAALIGIEELVDLDDLDDSIASTSNPNIMTNNDLGEAAFLIPLMKKWCTDVMALIEKRVMKGDEIPSGEDDEGETEHFKMVEGRSNRAWRDTKSAIKALKKARLKIDDYMPRQLITAPQAEKLIGKKHKIMTTEVHKPQGKPVLVVGSDNRKPYKTTITVPIVCDIDCCKILNPTCSSSIGIWIIHSGISFGSQSGCQPPSLASSLVQPTRSPLTITG